MHGLGNDFFLIDSRDKDLDYVTLSQLLCNREAGLETNGIRGADGVLYLEDSSKADYRMRIFNPDGSEPEMCGNGMRCFARYLYDKELTDKEELEIETKAGIIKPKINLENSEVKSVTVNMGKGKILEKMKEIKICDKEGVLVGITGHHVSIGNPHYVSFKPISPENLKEYGPLIENHGKFQPERTNVEFAKILGEEDLIRIYIWERGVGYTKACATGACATAFISRKLGSVDENVTVLMDGGYLDISVKDDDTIFMTGPAEYQGEGTIPKEILESIM